MKMLGLLVEDTNYRFYWFTHLTRYIDFLFWSRLPYKTDAAGVQLHQAAKLQGLHIMLTKKKWHFLKILCPL
jgi:hypothetical protein